MVGRTADGKVWHTIRTPTGWTPFGNVRAAAGRLDLEGLGEVVDVAAARRTEPALNGKPEGLYVLLALNDARAVLLFRNADTGAWTQEATAYFPHNARRVAAATSFIVSEAGGPSRSELHMAVVTDNGFLLTAIHEYASASPDVPADVEWFAGDRGDYRSVAMLGQGAIDTSNTSVELVTTTGDGRIFTTTGGPDTWSLFTEISGRPADVVDAAITSMGAETDFLAVTGDGRVWLAARNGAGTQPWRDLEEVNVVITGGGIVINHADHRRRHLPAGRRRHDDRGRPHSRRHHQRPSPPPAAPVPGPDVPRRGGGRREPGRRSVHGGGLRVAAPVRDRRPRCTRARARPGSEQGDDDGSCLPFLGAHARRGGRAVAHYVAERVDRHDASLWTPRAAREDARV